MDLLTYMIENTRWEIVTVFAILLAALLGAKYGKHKPSPNLLFTRGSATATRNATGKYDIATHIFLVNSGDAAVFCNKVRKNGIWNDALYNFEAYSGEKQIYSEFTSDDMPAKVIIELFAPKKRRVFKHVFREIELQ